MASVKVVTPEGEKVGEADLDEAVFGVEPNVAVMHQVVTAQLAARRAGTHSTKTRAEVAGGGSKPWRQKGTGRARHGSIRSPQWRGGGAAHGPKPRDYSQRTPKKVKRLALASALSDRARCDALIVVDRWRFSEPSTSAAAKALDAIGAAGKVLVVLGDDDSHARKSFRNLAVVHCLHYRELNTYDVVNSDVVVFTSETLPPVSGVAPGDDDSADADAAPDDAAEAVAADTEPADTGAVAEDEQAQDEEPQGDETQEDETQEAEPQGEESQGDETREAEAQEQEARVEEVQDVQAQSAEAPDEQAEAPEVQEEEEEARGDA
ncbi:MAG: 50S ribosomal protein L4 [Acidimicrobiaceae bacterium]|nr:50S ribosomal protein L4 [Acidimicrobiaceae bacterium]